MNHQMEKTDNRKLFTGLFCVALIFFPLLVISWNYDSDIWFLLNHGRYVLQSGFPTTEPFTLHEDFSFCMQQWLSSVLFWKVYEIFGRIGLIGIVFVVTGVTMLVAFRLCRMISGNNTVISAIITFVFGYVLCDGFEVTRPQIFTYLLALSEFYCLEKYVRDKKIIHLLPIPLFSVLQINLHGAMWIMLLLFYLPYLVSLLKIRVFKRLFLPGFSPKLPLIVCFVLTAVAGLLNPYGFKAITYIFKASGDKYVNLIVSEMNALSINGGLFFVLVLIATGCAYAYALKIGSRFELRYSLLSLGTLVLSLAAVKSVPYFAITGILPLAYYFGSLKIRLFSGNEKKDRITKAEILVLVALITVGGVIGNIITYQQNKDYSPAKAALEYLEKNVNPDDIALYTGYDEGGYAEFLGFHPYIDPRAEVFLKKFNGKKDVFREYYGVNVGLIYYRDFIDDYGFDYLLVRKSSSLDVSLSHDDVFEPIYQDDDYLIYKKCY